MFTVLTEPPKGTRCGRLCRLRKTNPVSRCRRRVAEPLRQSAARSLEMSPFVSIMEARNCNQLSLIQPDQRCIDHVFRRHDDGCGELLPRKAGDFPEVGRGHAWQLRLDADAFVSKLVLQGKAERN